MSREIPAEHKNETAMAGTEAPKGATGVGIVLEDVQAGAGRLRLKGDLARSKRPMSSKTDKVQVLQRMGIFSSCIYTASAR
jgi:membrane protein implicated in regulation of membrane protease activity